MKKLLLALIFAPFSLLAQDNYFVNDGNLSFLTQCPDEGYVGLDDEDHLIKVDADFGFEWGLTEFKGELLDLEVNQDSGQVVALYSSFNQYQITALTEDGDVIVRKSFTFPQNVGVANFSFLEDGYLFMMNAHLTDSSAIAPVILMRTDFSFDPTWIRSFHPHAGHSVKAIDFEVYDDTLATLTTVGVTDTNHSIFSRFSLDGERINSKKVGTDCIHYRDIARIPTTGEFVVVGEVDRDEDHGFKISVLSPEGIVKGTKQGRTSGSDSGSDRLNVDVLSDGRYVVSNRHWMGPGFSWGGRLMFFDNHKSVNYWYFNSPGPWGITSENLKFWGVDNNDQILFTCKVKSEEYGLLEKNVMGRMTWMSETCDIGTFYAKTPQYGIDPTTTVSFPVDTVLAIEILDIFDSLDDTVYTNIFDCSSVAYDLGPVVLDDHLYGDSVRFCNSLVPLDDDDDDDPVEDDGEDEDEDGIDDGGEDDPADLSLLETKKENIQIFPNPSNGQFTIEANGIVEIRIISTDGKEVERIFPTVDRITISEFNHKGLFIIQVLTNKGEWLNSKLIVQ